MQYEKPWSEEEVVARLLDGSLAFPPAVLKPLPPQPNRPRVQGYDGALVAQWNGEQARYVFEYTGASSPKALQAAALQAQAASIETGMLGLIILPYLREDALRELEQKGISCIDLCGNGVLIAPRFRIWRTGAPNRFKDTRPIRNPYRGDSSIFARCFLLRSDFNSLRDLQTFARQRTFGRENTEGAGLSLATASKVVTALEQEMVVSKQASSIRLTDARRLLALLRRGAEDPNRKRLVGKTPLGIEAPWVQLAKARSGNKLRSVATGLASASRYGLLAGVDKLSLYVDDLDIASQALDISPGRVFANIELIEDRKNAVYFDARPNDPAVWASPIQTWLELTLAGPRERDAARDLERRILEGDAEILT